MLTNAEFEKLDKMLKVLSKHSKWMCANYFSSIPLGWVGKKEPIEVVPIVRQLIEENKQLRLQLQQLKETND